MSRVKIALIGYNEFSHAQSIFPTVKSLEDDFEFVGYCLPKNEREKFPHLMNQLEGEKELTLSEILDNPEIEAVVIETEELYLTKYACLAAKAGKHIHMEKPGGVSLSDFENMISEVKRSGKVFHTGYMYRYNPAIMKLMADIKEGKLGDIISVEAQMNCNHMKNIREWLGNFPGGMMFFLGCHLVDLVLSIQGKPENIIPLNKVSGVDGTKSEDFGMAVLEYKNGVSFVKTTAVEVGGFSRRQLVVNGTKKTVEINPLEIHAGGYNQYTRVTERCDPTSWTDKGEATETEVFDRYKSMIESFAKMVKGEKTNPWSCDYELELYKTVLKCCGE